MAEISRIRASTKVQKCNTDAPAGTKTQILTQPSMPYARRKLDMAEISQIRAKLEETSAEVHMSSSDCQKERLQRSVAEQEDFRAPALVA